MENGESFVFFLKRKLLFFITRILEGFTVQSEEKFIKEIGVLVSFHQRVGSPLLLLGKGSLLLIDENQTFKGNATSQPNCPSAYKDLSRKFEFVFFFDEGVHMNPSPNWQISYAHGCHFFFVFFLLFSEIIIFGCRLISINEMFV